MEIRETALPGVLVLVPKRFGDDRGFFSESWNKRTLEQAGVDLPEFVQDNHSFSAKAGTIRGLHFQAPPHAQGKLVRCGRGRLRDVAVDVRRGSPSYGQWLAEELSFDNGCQLWIPAGFLHGFVTLEDETEILYKCTDYYAPECDGAVRWDSAGVDWGWSGEPLLSEKDARARPFADFVSPFTWEPGQ
jgi:dTDP-4-dehydrorhamnose 3,5-epimerase